MKHDLEHLIGKRIDDIDTPSLVVDLDAMERNLSEMIAFSKANKVRLRPHAKMHKSSALSLMQIQAGAVGVCVQKTSEAVILAKGGVDNIYISNEVIAPHKLQKVVTLARILDERGGRLAIAVDSLNGIQRLVKAARSEALGDGQIDVFIELYVGRCGVNSSEEVIILAKEIKQHPELRFAGLQAYHGMAQHIRSIQERRRAMVEVLGNVTKICDLLDTAGVPATLVTGAGTGTFGIEATSGLIGELQAGSFMFMDADYACNEFDVMQPKFEFALFIKTQVMSVCAEHAVCDAGHKSHAIDSGLPLVHKSELKYVNGGDEHGILRGPTIPKIDDVFWLIPGHCDPTINLHDVMVGVRGGLKHGLVEKIFIVDARGALF